MRARVEKVDVFVWNESYSIRNKYFKVLGERDLGHLQISPGSRFWGAFIVHYHPKSNGGGNYIKLVVLENKVLCILS